MAGNSFITELHAGYGERIPTLSETYGFYLFNRNDGYDYIGNVNLKAEKSWSGDLTFTYFTSSLQVSATGFYKYLPDYIFASAQADIRPMTPGANGVKVYHNIQSATFMVISTSCNLHITFGWLCNSTADLTTSLPLLPL
jgi:iron complex outermembrane receptor protein